MVSLAAMYVTEQVHLVIQTLFFYGSHLGTAVVSVHVHVLPNTRAHLTHTTCTQTSIQLHLDLKTASLKRSLGPSMAPQAMDVSHSFCGSTRERLEEIIGDKPRWESHSCLLHAHRPHTPPERSLGSRHTDSLNCYHLIHTWNFVYP